MSDKNNKNSIRRHLSLDDTKYVLGDGLGNFNDVDGRVFVRYRQSGGLSMPITVLPPIPSSVVRKQGANISVLWNQSGDQYIAGPDVDGARASGYDVSTPTEPPKFVGQKSINVLLPVATETLVVNFTSYGRIYGTYSELAGLSADYTGYAASAGHKNYVSAFLKPDGTIGLVGSSERPVYDPALDESDINETLIAADPTWQPIWAIPLQNDPSTIVQSDIDLGRDLRQFLNLPNTISGDVIGPGSATAGDLVTFVDPTHIADSGILAAAIALIANLKYQILKIGGSAQTARGILNLIAGTNVTLTPVDRSGTDTTDVTIDVAASAPTSASYITKVAEAGLSNEFALASLATGILKNTTATGVPSIAAAGTDYTSPTGTENLSNKTIDSSSIGTTTPAVGYFSALRVKIGGFFAILTHANTADRTYTLPDTTGNVVIDTAAQTLTNKSIDAGQLTGSVLIARIATALTTPGPIGGTTASTAIFSALSILIGGFKAIFTHANTADRTYTLPDATGTIVLDTAIQTLTQKTLTSPTIGNFTNAGHNHTNAAGGGQLTDAALSSAVTVAKGGTGVATLPAHNALIGNGTGNVNSLAPGTNRNVMKSDGTDWQSSALVAADIPNLPASQITSGQLALARGGTNADLSATGAANSFLKQSSSGAAVTVGTIGAADIATALGGITVDPTPSIDITDSLGTAALRWLKGFFKSISTDYVEGPVLNDPSGGTVAIGVVGYITYDSTNGKVFKTTTTANLKGVDWCVVTSLGTVGTGAANTLIKVATYGTNVTVVLNANCAIGDYLTTSTTAGRAAVNTAMRAEVFARALTANSGGAGGTCLVQLLTKTKTENFTNPNDTLRIDLMSSTDFVATINGAPSGSTLTYNAPSSGSDNTIKTASSSQAGKIVLYNTTLGGGASLLISSVNTTTKVITFTTAVPGTWLSTHTITARSQTATGTFDTNAYFYDIDLTGLSLPDNVRAINWYFEAADSGAPTGGFYSIIYPFQAQANIYSVGLALVSLLASPTIFTTSVVPSLANVGNKVCVGVKASGSATASVILRIRSIEIGIS